MGSKWTTAFIATFCGMAASIAFSLILGARQGVPGFGVVRLDHIVADHIRTVGSMDMSDDEREQRATDFASALTSAIEHVSISHGVTLLVAPAVVSQVPDYTEEVQGTIYAALGLATKVN